MNTEAMQVKDAVPRYLAETEAQQVPPGYKRTEVGVVPEDWTTRPLRDDISLLSGHHVLAQHCNVRGDGTPYLTGPADFPNGRIEQTKFTTKPTTLCRAGDILVTVKGSGSGTLVEANAEYCISRQLMAVRTAEWNSKFLFYSLIQHASGIKAASTGLIPGLSRSDVLNQVIPLPKSPPEQSAIAEALSDMDELLGALEALIAKKRAIKLAAMQQLLTGKIRLPGFSGAWEKKKIGDIALLSGERNSLSDELPVLACSKHLGFIDSLGYFKNRVFSKDLSSYKVIRRGEIGYPANHLEEGSIGLQDLYDLAS